MKEKTCCFTGHRVLPAEKTEMIKNKTKDFIKLLIKKNITFFICGGAVGYDMLCAQIILRFKKINSDIKLIIAMPCAEQDKFYNAADKRAYAEIISGADEIICLSKNFYTGCMHARNRFMADHSSYLISYCTKNSGGSFYTREYAKKHALTIFDV